MPPTFLAVTPSGLLTFIPSSMADERAKDNLANTARLICAGDAATAAVLMFEFSFGEYDGPQGDSFAGRFAELMPPQPATADQRALARQLLDVMGLTEAVLRGTPFNN